MKNQVVGLNSLSIKSSVQSFSERSLRKRVFTDDELKFLRSRPIDELKRRIGYGSFLISLLYRPEMLNMTSAQANMVSSNLRFQQDEIRNIIKEKELQNG